MKNPFKFENFVLNVHEIMRTNYGLEPNDYDDETHEQIKNAFEGKDTPEQFCDWYAERYGLSDIRDTGFGIKS